MPVQDAVFLLAERRERPMHVGGLQLFRPAEGRGPDAVGEVHRWALAHTEVLPRLARKPVRALGGLGPWAWADDPLLDLEYHVRHSALPHPGRIRELLALVSRLHGSLLDRTRPLWETHLIEGLDDGRFALYTKVHHALVDGVGAMRLMERGLATSPDEDRPPPWAAQPGRASAVGTTERPPLPQRALRGATEMARAMTGAGETAVRALARGLRDEAAALPYQAPRSMLNVPISGARRFAADSWSLQRVAAVRRATGATVNDVVLAMSAGALRRYLLELDALPRDPLIAMVPVSLREAGDEETANAVGLILVNLATDRADPGARFEAIRASVRQGKERLVGLHTWGVLALSGLTVAPLGLAPLFHYESLRRPPFNVIISNVPGPRQPLYLHGARLEGTYPLSIPVDGQALNITVLSYVDELGFGLTGCRRSVPHLQRLLEGLEASLTELEEL